MLNWIMPLWKSKPMHLLSLKYSMAYVGYSKIVEYVPHSTIKYILGRWDYLKVRGKWVENIQEYDLEIRSTKLINGKGFANFPTKGDETALGIDSEINLMTSTVLGKLEQHEWYANIIY